MVGPVLEMIPACGVITRTLWVTPTGNLWRDSGVCAPVDGEGWGRDWGAFGFAPVDGGKEGEGWGRDWGARWEKEGGVPLEREGEWRDVRGWLIGVRAMRVDWDEDDGDGASDGKRHPVGSVRAWMKVSPSPSVTFGHAQNPCGALKQIIVRLHETQRCSSRIVI